jgi:hypothetical protein
VHLCSEELEKTWSVRQVSTSNEVYVVQASCAREKNAADRDAAIVDAGQHSAVLTAIAKADSILELLPVTADIEVHLRKLLPAYDHEQLVRLYEEFGELRELNEVEEHARLLSQIPAPDVSVRKVWQQLCVSRCSGSREEYFIPTARLLESAWTSALAAYNIRGSGKGIMERADFEDEDDGASELLPVKNAIWQRLCTAEGAGLERIQTATWVVRTSWQSMWEMPTSEHRRTEKRLEIEDIWRNMLPREYAVEASIDRLEASTYEPYEQEGEEMIRWTGQSKVIQAAQPTIANPGKKKWHEKFRDSRNANG